MSGLTSRRVMTSQLINPTSAPRPMPTPSATTTGTPASTIVAMTQPVNPTMEPTERSIPRLEITKVWPTAMMRNTAACRVMFIWLVKVRNRSLSNVTARESTISA